MAISAQASLGQYIMCPPPASVTLHMKWAVGTADHSHSGAFCLLYVRIPVQGKT